MCCVKPCWCYLSQCQCVKPSPLSAAYMCQWMESALVQIMACHLFGTKPLSKPMLGYCQLELNSLQWNFIKLQNLSFAKIHLKMWSARMAAILSRGELTHWGRVMHICISNLTIIGSDNGLSPGRRQAIIWTKDGILLIWTSGTNLSEILSEIHAFSSQEMYLKTSSGKCWPFCLSLNVLKHVGVTWASVNVKPCWCYLCQCQCVKQCWCYLSQCQCVKSCWCYLSQCQCVKSCWCYLSQCQCVKPCGCYLSQCQYAKPCWYYSRDPL